MLRILILSLAIFFAAARAGAETVVIPAAGTQVDLAWLANAGITFAATVLPILASVVVYLVNKSKVSATAKLLIDQVMTNGASLVATRLGGIHIAHASIPVKNAALGTALNYVLTAAGPQLAARGYDPASPDGELHILNMIEARVPLVQAATGITAAPPAPTATVLEAQPILQLGTALATDPHTVTTGEALAAAHAAIALVPEADKQAAVTAAENALPENLKGVLGLAAGVAGV